ncbi:MAG TPA: cytochrome c oxidase assembly protein, partial [Microthrixaceae bacterium]|nr:cytochrome c oxidase assembly protein [Microthrixaceae bacterium]
MTAAFAASAFPTYQWHPEVWVLVVGMLGLGWYVLSVIQPRAVAAGHPPVTAAQKRWFLLAVALVWVASAWPLHDVAEERLYSAHMFQHMILTVVMPP